MVFFTATKSNRNDHIVFILLLILAEMAFSTWGPKKLANCGKIIPRKGLLWTPILVKKSIVPAVWLKKVKVQFGKCPYFITVYSKDRKIVSKVLVHLDNALLI